MNCRNCKDKALKNGKQKNGRQRYYCGNCKTSFQKEYTYNAYVMNINNMIVQLLKEGCGVRSISRILEISATTVLSRMLLLAEATEVPNFLKLGLEFEVDEVYVKIINGNAQNYLTYAIERKSKTIIGFVLGSRSKDNIAPLIQKVLLLKPRRVFTDKMSSYPSLIPKEIHRKFRYGTNRIERNHLTLRTHIKRLSRRTICFSKKEKYLEAHLKIYFWG